MTQEKINIPELLVSYDATAAEMLQRVAAFNESEINTVPFEDSWTPAQVADHVTKANNGMLHFLEQEGKQTGRNPDAGIAGLKATFLNFETKLKSPDFILPSRGTYQRDLLIAALEKSSDQIKAVARRVDLSTTVSHPVFGELTKLEIMHFLWYHTQRHIHQLKNIHNAINVNHANP